MFSVETKRDERSDTDPMEGSCEGERAPRRGMRPCLSRRDKTALWQDPFEQPAAGEFQRAAIPATRRLN